MNVEEVQRRLFLSLPIEFTGKESCAFTGPSQRRFWIATHDRINKSVQGMGQFRIMLRQIFSSTSWKTRLQRCQFDRLFQFLDSSPNRWHGNSRCLLHETDTSSSKLTSFDGAPNSPGTLGKRRRHQLKLFPNITNYCLAVHDGSYQLPN